MLYIPFASDNNIYSIIQSYFSVLIYSARIILNIQFDPEGKMQSIFDIADFRQLPQKYHLLYLRLSLHN